MKPRPLSPAGHFNNCPYRKCGDGQPQYYSLMTGPRIQPLMLVTLGLAALVLLSSCARSADVPEKYQDRGNEVRVITAVYETNDPSAIEVEWAARPCETFDRTEVDYSSNRVDITVHVFVDSFACDDVPDLSTTVVQLDGPLDGREVWDDELNDSQPILVQPAR